MYFIFQILSSGSEFPARYLSFNWKKFSSILETRILKKFFFGIK